MNINVDELVKSRPEAMFANYHEGHEEHEAEIIIYFLPLRVLRALRGENQIFYDFINVERPTSNDEIAALRHFINRQHILFILRRWTFDVGSSSFLPMLLN